MRRSSWHTWIAAVTAFITAALALLWRQVRPRRLAAPDDRPAPPQVEPEPQPVQSPEPARPATWPPGNEARIVIWASSLGALLFGLGMIVIALTRFVGLEDFPIYFFGDEAAQSVLAADFVHAGFRDYLGRLFPTYFLNVGSFNLSLSVYLQVIPYLLFGHVVFVTRAVCVLIALSGAVALGLILRDHFKARLWWAGPLLLSITPAWFLHSRTAFESVLAVSFYAWALYFYLRYRHGRPRSLFLALLFAALAFYSYNGSQLVVVLTGVLFLLFDLRYHRRQLRLVAAGLAFGVVLALPYVRFQIEQPQEVFLHLYTLDSYWLRNDLTPADKIGQFVKEYLFGLDPDYWYSPNNDRDLIRHQMKGYGHILPITLPFALIGLIVCWRTRRSPPQRAALIAALAAPVGGALVEVHVLRVLMFVLPAALFTTLGLEAALERLAGRFEYRRVAFGLFTALCAINFALLWDALRNAPTWYVDYGLNGTQYGARQVFAEARAYLARSPQTRILLSPTWANGADLLLSYFAPNEARLQMGNVEAFRLHKLDLGDDLLLIMTPDEYANAANDPKFTDLRVEQITPYPNGAPGFYFARLRYSDQADALFAAEQEALRQPVDEPAQLGDQTIDTRHTRFDIGEIGDLFDGDLFNVVRTQEINPAVVDLIFPQPRSIGGLTLTVGSMDFALTVRLYAAGDSEPVEYTRTYTQLPPDPTVALDIDVPLVVRQLTVEVRDINAGEASYVHLRELTLRD